MNGAFRTLLPCALALSAPTALLAQHTPPAHDAAPIIASDTAFVVHVPGLIPENIAFDARRNGYYIGDLLGQRVLFRGPDGTTRVFAGPDVVRGGVVGMKTDERRGLLWLAVWPDTARMSAAERAGAPRSLLLALELESGRVAHRFVPPDSLAPHLFNDLVIRGNGEILLTDSEAGRVYRLASPAGSLEPWLQPPAFAFAYPNGIALSPDEKTVYVAYAAGVVAVELATRAIRHVRPPAGFTIAGIDGLYARGDVLVGIQNGGPQADGVIAFAVRDGVVTATRLLERRHPAYQVPTTGVLVGDGLHYIANAQLDRLNAGDTADPARPLAPVVVLVLRVPPLD